MKIVLSWIFESCLPYFIPAVIMNPKFSIVSNIYHLVDLSSRFICVLCLISLWSLIARRCGGQFCESFQKVSHFLPQGFLQCLGKLLSLCAEAGIGVWSFWQRSSEVGSSKFLRELWQDGIWLPITPITTNQVNNTPLLALFPSPISPPLLPHSPSWDHLPNKIPCLKPCQELNATLRQFLCPFLLLYTFSSVPHFIRRKTIKK